MVGEMFRFWDRCEKPAPEIGTTCEQLGVKRR